MGEADIRPACPAIAIAPPLGGREVINSWGEGREEGVVLHVFAKLGVDCFRGRSSFDRAPGFHRKPAPTTEGAEERHTRHRPAGVQSRCPGWGQIHGPQSIPLIHSPSSKAPPNPLSNPTWLAQSEAGTIILPSLSTLLEDRLFS